MAKKKKKKAKQTEPEVSGSKRHFIAFALLGISIFLAYANSLNGTWAMDDVVTNRPVGINNIHDLMGFRKVAYLTFLLNQYIAPFSPVSFRLFNILIHLLNSVLVYVLAYKTMGLVERQAAGKHESNNRSNLKQARSDTAFYAAIISSVIFALHPININAVAYIVQRMASLASLFVLLSILCYISAVKSTNTLKSAMFYALSGIFIFAGIFSKENAVMAVLLIFLYDYVFLSTFNFRAFIKRVLFISFIGIASLGITSYLLGFHHTFVDLVKFFFYPNKPLKAGAWMAVDVYWTPFQHILTEFRVVSRYIFLVFVPLPQLLVFDWWGFPVSKGITEPVTTLLSMVFLLSLLVFSVLKIKRLPFLSFGILWYLLAISLESFVAVGADLYFEHRNYLPVSGLIIGIVGQTLVLLEGKLKEKNVWAAALVFCVLLGSLTFARNFVWKDSITLWNDTLRKDPANLRAMMSMGNAYWKLLDMDNTEKFYKEVVRLSSAFRRLHFLNDSAYSLGMMYLLSGKFDSANKLIEIFDKGIESYKLKILRGLYKAQNNDIEGALRDYNEVIGKTEGLDTVVVYTLMGDAYRATGLLDKAIEHYNKAISLDLSFSSAYYGIAVAYMGKRNLILANDYLNKSLSVDPDNILALSDMAELMLIRKSKPEDALAYAQKAVSKSPPFYQPYLTMGNVLIVLGREKESDEFYKKAVERGMSDYMVPFSKARAFYIRGDREKANYYLSELRRYKVPEKIKSFSNQAF